MKIYTIKELTEARWGLRIMGLCFVGVGAWIKYANFGSCDESRFLTKLLVAIAGKENCASSTGWVGIGLGVILICASFLKPYQDWNINRKTK